MRGSTLFSRALLFLLLSTCTLSEGCMVSKDRVEMGPFYYRRPVPRPEATESAVLWPLFQKYKSPTVSQVAFRPLVNFRWEDTGGELRGNMYEVQALWPLFLYRRTEGTTRLKIRLLPAFNHVRFEHPDGSEEVDTSLLPFVLTGSSPEEGSYFAFFPFGGTLRGLFGKDRIRFALFPLYADTQQGDHRSWHLLWPVFRYSKGGGKSSFQFWPLFGWKQKEDWYKKVFVLWPFFARVQLGLDTDRPTDSWFFLPFYARQQTPFGKIDYFLYPLFSYQRQERPGYRFREWTLPWPFVQIARGDRERRNSFWPIWGKHTKPEYANTFFLYPVGRIVSYGTPAQRTQRRYVLPLYWDWRVTEEGRFAQGRFKGWPFWDYTKRGEREKEFRTISPLWFWRPEGGFERNYSDFWKVYVQRSWPDGFQEKRFLWYPWYTVAPDHAGEGQAAEEVPEGAADGSSLSGPPDTENTGWLSESAALEGLFDQVKGLGLW
jgi:hypothetical protein